MPLFFAAALVKVQVIVAKGSPHPRFENAKLSIAFLRLFIVAYFLARWNPFHDLDLRKGIGNNLELDYWQAFTGEHCPAGAGGYPKTKPVSGSLSCVFWPPAGAAADHPLLRAAFAARPQFGGA